MYSAPPNTALQRTRLRAQLSFETLGASAKRATRAAAWWAGAVFILFLGQGYAVALSEKSDVVVEVRSDRNPSRLGQPITFAALTTASWNPDLPSTVTFFDGALMLGTIETGPKQEFCVPPPAPCYRSAAALTVSTLSLGNHEITARYDGNAEHNAATSPVLVQVVLASAIPTTSDLAKIGLALALVLSGIWFLQWQR